MSGRYTRTEKLTRVVYALVLASFVAPIAFLIWRIAAWDAAAADTQYRTQADYILMLVQCALGVVVINLPMALARRFRFDVPAALYLMYILFLYCAIFLGEVRAFYYKVPHWDVILHAFSSVMAGAFGFLLVALLNHSERTAMSLSPFFVSLFAFCFSVTIGAVWEVYEFTFDGLLGLNMQKFITAQGVTLSGHEALRDTMKDIVVDCAGALAASVAGFFSLRGKSGWASDLISRSGVRKEKGAA